MKTLLIFVVGITLIAVGCSHSSGEGANTSALPNFGTELVIPSTFVTLPKEEAERIFQENDEGVRNGDFSLEESFSMLNPGSPAWNSLVVQFAEIRQPFAIEYNKCSVSLDAFYDFENPSITPIEKSIEMSLRYSFEFSAIVWWLTSFNIFDHSIE